MKILLYSVVALVLCGCAPKELVSEAKIVKIVYETPDKNRCTHLGEVIGSQGNWITGDYTANKDLIIGARNELRNEAYKLGANVVHMETMKDAQAWGSLGTSNTTAIGQAYICN